MKFNPRQSLKQIRVENPQLAYAPLDGPIAPLVGATAIEGNLYRVIGWDGNIAILQELTAGEFAILNEWRQRLPSMMQEED